MQLASEHGADMVLLSGNLFHDNKPSRMAMQSAIEVLRNHCLGDRDVGISVVSDQGASFHGPFPHVNYEDPHFNVQLPVFAIHGDRDDPGGQGGLSALDLLASANLLNYFGLSRTAEKLAIHPVLIQKGFTNLALYGLGHMRDEQLTSALEKKQLTLAVPGSEEARAGNAKEGEPVWFNLLALHQNRGGRGAAAQGCVREALLPSMMDMVVWGHMPECRLAGGTDGVEETAENDFVVVQPGSTIVSELVEPEARPKHAGLLSLRGDQWKLDPLPLRTVRPFVTREVCLREHEEEYDLHSEEQLCELLEAQVDAVLEEIAAKNTTTPLTEADENRAKYSFVMILIPTLS